MNTSILDKNSELAMKMRKAKRLHGKSFEETRDEWLDAAEKAGHLSASKNRILNAYQSNTWGL